MRQTLDNAGAPIATASYDPWGTPQGSAISPFGFTGELQDAAGLTYLRARWYTPGTGTLLGVDPFEGFPEQPYTQHPFQYAYSNPVLWTDPSGRYVAVNDEGTDAVGCISPNTVYNPATGQCETYLRGSWPSQPAADGKLGSFVEPNLDAPLIFTTPKDVGTSTVFDAAPVVPNILITAAGPVLPGFLGTPPHKEKVTCFIFGKDLLKDLGLDKGYVTASDGGYDLFENLDPSDRPGSFAEVKIENLLRGYTSNRFIYVVTEDGSLIIGRRPAGHVDVAYGQPVRAAGEVKFVLGKIREVNNLSGHYQPSGPSAKKEAIEAFRRYGFGDVPYKEYYKDPETGKMKPNPE